MNRVPLVKKVLSENARIAAELRERFLEHDILCLNILGSPGAGKTSLLERTLQGFAPGDRVAVLTGDIQTDNDAARLARFGFPVRQITTGGTCHLEAKMIERALEVWPLADLDVLFIENVGNLVCPAGYDLGETSKVVVLSAAEGDDKPLKYPSMFFKSSLMVLNKIDLLPHVAFDVAAARTNAHRVHPGMDVVELSCTTGEGFDRWRDWLHKQRELRDAEMIAGIA